MTSGRAASRLGLKEGKCLFETRVIEYQAGGSLDWG